MSEPKCETCAYRSYKRRLGRTVLRCTRYPMRTSEIQSCADWLGPSGFVAKVIKLVRGGRGES